MRCILNSGDGERRRPPRRRRWLRHAVLVVAVLVLAGTGAAAWGGTRGADARDHLWRAVTLVHQLRGQLRHGDPAATQTLDRLQAEIRSARSDTDDPLWRAGVHLPAVGDDVAAVRTVATALDDLARHGLPPLVAAATTVGSGSLLPGRGRVDVTALRRGAAELATADGAFRRAVRSVDAIDVGDLTSPVRTAVGQLTDQLRQASHAVTVAAAAVALLPPALGADGPRTYLLLLQNLAEARATGGMPGAFVAVRADRGQVTIVDERPASTLRRYATPVLPLAPDDRQLYADRPAVFPADINLTPHFAVAAALARAMYRESTGVTADAVFATDPVALSYVLRATGPVPVPGGDPLTAADAVPLLLSRIYADGRSAGQQDAYFAAAARAVFQALVNHPVDRSALVAALVRGARERRLLGWSTRAAENRLLTGTPFAGELPVSDGADPTVGVFLNDGSGAKLGYYLTHGADLAVTPTCRADGRRELRLRVTLGSTAPRAGLSADVLGLGLAGDPYVIRTNVSIYSPTGGSLLTMTLNGAGQPFGATLDRRRAVGTVTVDLKPGSRATLDVTMLTGVPAGGYGAAVVPRLWTTPGVAPWPQSIESGVGCPRNR